MSSIKVIVTGGTIDKEYNEISGSLYFKKTQIFEMLALSRLNLDTDIEELMLVDSLEMNTSQREKISESCLRTKSNKIVITHGTDTMVTTARFLADKNIDKTVVLTGAMVPYKLGRSDGSFNLGNALAFVQTMPSGVYICMNGQIFNWNNVTKNKDLGKFETLDPPSTDLL